MLAASRNSFALLEEDGAKSVPESAPPTTTATTDQPPTRGGQRGRGNRGGSGSRGGKYYQRGGSRTSTIREGLEDDGAEDSAGKKVENIEGNRGRGRGRGGRGRGDRDGPRGGGGGGGGGGGRREYDRRSATGKTDSEKKINQSWGGGEGRTELAAETAAADDAAAEKAAPAENWGPPQGGGDWEASGEGGNDWGAGAGGGDDWGAGGGNADWSAPAPASTTKPEEPAERTDRRTKDRPEEEPDNTLTLEEYQAQQKSVTLPQLEPRKVAHDEDTWRGATELIKGADEREYIRGKPEPPPKVRQKKGGKIFLDIEARFERPSTRGGRGRGEPRRWRQGRTRTWPGAWRLAIKWQHTSLQRR